MASNQEKHGLLNTGRKLALVIGINEYKYIRRLRNSCNDTQNISTALRLIGFTVTTKTDLILQQAIRVCDEFKSKLAKGDIVLFYFSGHGAGIEGQNCLLLKDFDHTSEGNKRNYLRLQHILDNIGKMKPSLVMLLLDCCHSHQKYGGHSRNRSYQSDYVTFSLGIHPLTFRTESIVTYSVTPGSIAIEDLNERPSLFTEQLVKHMMNSNQDIPTILCNVTKAVIQESELLQVPFVISSLGERSIRLISKEPTEDKSRNEDQTPNRRKLALLIGIFEYNYLMALNSGLDSVYKMATALEEIGFVVTKQINLTKHEAESTIQEFTANVRKEDIVLFYFFGHGFQWRNQNFLIPKESDANGDRRIRQYVLELLRKRDVIDYASDINYKNLTENMIHVQKLIHDFSERLPSVTICLLDCRQIYDLSNPGTKRRTPKHNHVNNDDIIDDHIRINTEWLVGFACGPEWMEGETCIPNPGLFTKYLVQQIVKIKKDIRLILGAVIDKVKAESSSKLIPYYCASLSKSNIILCETVRNKNQSANTVGIEVDMESKDFQTNDKSDNESDAASNQHTNKDQDEATIMSPMNFVGTMAGDTSSMETIKPVVQTTNNSESVIAPMVDDGRAKSAESLGKKPSTDNVGVPDSVKCWLSLDYVASDSGSIKRPHELEKNIILPPAGSDEIVLSRIQGSMIGLALGDALGAHVEFRPRAFLLQHPVTELQSGGTWGLEKGQFTDDTSMALCLAASLISCRDFIPYDQLVRYKWWYRHGYMSSTGHCFDIGTATSESLGEFERRQNDFSRTHQIPLSEMDTLADPVLLNEFNVKCSGEGVAGNGALMRLAPVPLFFFRHPSHAVEFSGLSGEITHGDRKAYDACRYYGALIVAAVNGMSKDELLSEKFVENNESWFGGKELAPEIFEIAVNGSFKRQGGYDDGIRGKGYIVSALEAALWAFWSTKDFEQGALAAVNLGDDADTTAAIYGQLAGAYYGYEALPQDWVEKVYAKDFILGVSKWLAYEGEKWTIGTSLYAHLSSASLTSQSIDQMIQEK